MLWCLVEEKVRIYLGRKDVMEYGCSKENEREGERTDRTERGSQLNVGGGSWHG